MSSSRVVVNASEQAARPNGGARAGGRPQSEAMVFPEAWFKVDGIMVEAGGGANPTPVLP